jgi:AraC family transcriptional regulator
MRRASRIEASTMAVSPSARRHLTLVPGDPQYPVPVLSSRTRGWNAIVVELYRTREIDVCAPFPEHAISMHLRGPVHLVQQRHGRAHHRTMYAGDIIVTSAGEPKHVQHEEEAEVVKLRLSCDYLNAIAENALGADARRVRVIDDFGTRDVRLSHLARQFLSELETCGLASELYVESLTLQLAVHLLRHYSTAGTRLPQQPAKLPRYKLQRAIDYINDNLAADLTLGGIAGAVPMSPYHFAHLFKETMGDSPHQYVIQLRVEHAKRLLRATELPVTEVAQQVGYVNAGHFSSIFHRCIGLTPTRYRSDKGFSKADESPSTKHSDRPPLLADREFRFDSASAPQDRSV